MHVNGNTIALISVKNIGSSSSIAMVIKMYTNKWNCTIVTFEKHIRIIKVANKKQKI